MKLSGRFRAGRRRRQLTILVIVVLSLAALVWPVRAQAGTPAAPSLTPTSPSNEASVTLYLPPNQPTAVIQVDCQLPGDDGWCRMPVRVSLLGNAAGSPIGRLDYVLDGQALSEVRDSFVYEDGLTGIHTISLTAVDLLGRRSAGVSQAYMVDRSLPVSAFNGFADNGLSISISDEGSGVVGWTVQVFDGQDQSVFFQDGSGPMVGALNWVALIGVYQVELFVRDAAGNESHFPRTAFAVATPTPAFILEQVFGLFASKATATPKPTKPPASATPAGSAMLRPATEPQSSSTPAPTALPAINGAPTQSRPLSPEPHAPALAVPNHAARLGRPALFTLLALLSTWAVGAALDRRASAVAALAGELGALWSTRAQGGTLP